ncbi:hypothetical protein TNCV_2470971 [Trichonephila clavipes]|nr:hypothetical protein TNCV_2470971 [Trichonephila clavipes]
MATLVSRRRGSVFVCYSQIGLGRPRADFCRLLMRRDVGRAVDPPWCLKGFFRRRDERALGVKNLRRALKKRETWMVEDIDWSGKKGETMNAGVVGELE